MDHSVPPKSSSTQTWMCDTEELFQVQFQVPTKQPRLASHKIWGFLVARLEIQIDPRQEHETTLALGKGSVSK